MRGRSTFEHAARATIDPSEFGAKLSVVSSGGRMGRLAFLFLFAVAASFAAAAGLCAEASSPSFACTPGGTEIERIICSDPRLAAEDRLMARLYVLAQVSAFGKGPSNELAVQRQWLKERDICLHADLPPAKCLTRPYARRNEQLALAILFAHPEIALPELRRLDPEAAGMFEAIYLYARTPRLSEGDRRQVAALLRPYVAGKDESAWGEPSPDDAAKNDSAFAEFVGIRSVYIGGDDDGRAFPCAAVVRKPKLIDATGPRFGSNMDNFVIQSDCRDTLPPLPRFTALVEKRESGMTDCGGGSIRFAYYRSFSNDVLAALLATSAQLRNKPAKPFPLRRNVSNADVDAAVGELAAYYVRYDRAAPAKARPLARQMIYQMLDEAWQC